MVIFGIDPGSSITGYGVIRVQGNAARWVDAGVIKASSRNGLPDRLRIIFDGLREVLDRYRPDVVCLEQAFYAKNVHTTLILGHARGVAMLSAQMCGARIEEYSPREIKKAVVGVGAATKTQVEYMVRVLLSPPVQNLPSDASDALAAALCGFGRVAFHDASKLARI